MSKAQKRGDAKPVKPELWQKSSYANLIRYVPSGLSSVVAIALRGNHDEKYVRCHR